MSSALRDRIQGLDGLRAIAVIMVICFHTWPETFPGGGFGVQIFFVLSGFLITTLLLKEMRVHGRLYLWKFYLRRILRLFPALYAVLALTATAYLLWAPEWMGPRVIVSTATYTGNWSRALGQGLGPLGHTWSLATEEQFYLIWPIGIVAVAAWSRRFRVIRSRSLEGRVGLLAVAGILVTTLAGVLESKAGAGTARLGNAFEVASLPLWVGCALGCWWSSGRRPGRVVRWLGASSALVLAVGTFLVPTSWVADKPWVAVSGAMVTAALIFLVASGTGSRILEQSFLRRIGVISYGMYLWHYPICFIFIVNGYQGPLLAGGVLVTTYLVAELSYRYVEQPFLRMKRHAYPVSRQPDTLQHPNLDEAKPTRGTWLTTFWRRAAWRKPA